MVRMMLSVRAKNILIREFSRVPEPHEMVDVIRKHRFVRELGWPLFTTLMSFKGVGWRTADEIADYAGIKR
jgi:hypothetical protein